MNLSDYAVALLTALHKHNEDKPRAHLVRPLYAQIASLLPLAFVPGCARARERP